MTSMAKESKIGMFVSSKSEDDGTLYFTLTSTNVSVANGLRRTILADIPTLVFKTFPDKENKAKFVTNTSRFNNEILKQRLQCIPIHGITHDQPYDELEVIIDKKNDSHDMMLVTTADFKIKNTKSDKFLADSVLQKIFPTDPITGDHILFARLRPRISNEVPGEELQIQAKMSLHTASEDGAFNVVSCCTYRNTPDKINQDREWQEVAKTLNEGENVEMARKDWYNHKAGRVFIKDSFDFKIQTVGVFENADIVKNACVILANKLIKLAGEFAMDKIGNIIQSQSSSTIQDSYDLKLDGVGYTIGKVLEYIIHEKYYGGASILSYIGFRKNHPHDSHSIIRIAFKDDESINASTQLISQIFVEACQEGIAIYNSIASEF